MALVNCQCMAPEDSLMHGASTCAYAWREYIYSCMAPVDCHCMAPVHMLMHGAWRSHPAYYVLKMSRITVNEAALNVDQSVFEQV